MSLGYERHGQVPQRRLCFHPVASIWRETKSPFDRFNYPQQQTVWYEGLSILFLSAAWLTCLAAGGSLTPINPFLLDN